MVSAQQQLLVLFASKQSGGTITRMPYLTVEMAATATAFQWSKRDLIHFPLSTSLVFSYFSNATHGSDVKQLIKVKG